MESGANASLESCAGKSLQPPNSYDRKLETPCYEIICWKKQRIFKVILVKVIGSLCALIEDAHYLLSAPLGSAVKAVVTFAPWPLRS